MPDSGLPTPDLLLHFKLEQSEAESRGGFGGERYEVSTFQEKVRHQVGRLLLFSAASLLSYFLTGFFFSPQYEQLYQSHIAVKPEVLDVTGMSIEDVGSLIEQRVDDAWNAPRRSLTETLW